MEKLNGLTQEKIKNLTHDQKEKLKSNLDELIKCHKLIEEKLDLMKEALGISIEYRKGPEDSTVYLSGSRSVYVKPLCGKSSNDKLGPFIYPAEIEIDGKLENIFLNSDGKKKCLK